MAKGTLLIVDDEPPVRKIVASMLRSEGYVILEASSGPEALEVCAEHECRIDLLLTDLIMPGMTGRMLADILIAKCSGLGVIFMSGYIDASRTETKEEGLHFIQKPFDKNQLKAMISDVMGKKEKSA